MESDNRHSLHDARDGRTLHERRTRCGDREDDRVTQGRGTGPLEGWDFDRRARDYLNRPGGNARGIRRGAHEVNRTQH
jgi:hypothetical protein